MGHVYVSALRVLLFLSVLAINSRGQDAWKEVTAWIAANGGTVHPKLHAGPTSHGGMEVRGILTNKGLAAKETLLSVPRKLWIERDNFVAYTNSSLDDLSACHMDPLTLEVLRLASAMAVEAKDGSKSFYSPFINSLPSLSDFQSFFPRFAESSLLLDFRALPIAEFAEEMQDRDDNTRACFEAWRGHPGSPEGLAKLDWEQDMTLALVRIRTRSYFVNGRPVQIPGSDLLNTGKKSALNTKWSANRESFKLLADRNASEGEELYEFYCDGCDNNRMMSTWGVYLEDNPNYLSAKEKVDCGSKRLREAAEAVLVVPAEGSAAATEMLENKWTAPRCRSSALSGGTQGPMRCSFARLAYEYCSTDWGYGAKFSPPQGNGISRGIAAIVAAVGSLTDEAQESDKELHSHARQHHSKARASHLKRLRHKGGAAISK